MSGQYIALGKGTVVGYSILEAIQKPMRSVYSLIYRLKLIAPLLTSVMGSPYPEE
jgi:hypothetical protein